jgi:hypothetical protein
MFLLMVIDFIYHIYSIFIFYKSSIFFIYPKIVYLFVGRLNRLSFLKTCSSDNSRLNSLFLFTILIKQSSHDKIVCNTWNFSNNDIMHLYKEIYQLNLHHHISFFVKKIVFHNQKLRHHDHHRDQS